MSKLAAEPKRWISVTAPRVGFATCDTCLIRKVAMTLTDDLQHRCEQMRTGGEADAQPDRERKHPIGARVLEG